jgi:hypothetical protein
MDLTPSHLTPAMEEVIAIRAKRLASGESENCVGSASPGNNVVNLFRAMIGCGVASVANPDPGSDAFLTPGSGMKSRDHISESLENNCWG